MKLSVVLTGTLIVFYLGGIDVARAIDCYRCHYVEGMSQEELASDNFEYDKELFDESCKPSSTPDSKFLKSCPAGYSCSETSFTGKHPRTEREVTVSWRACFDPVDNVKGKCKSMTVPELEADPEWNPDNGFEAEFVSLRKILVLPQSRTNICYCESNKCNGATN